MFPVDAMTPRSVACHRDRGPSSPKGETETQTARGAISGFDMQRPRPSGCVDHGVRFFEQFEQARVLGPLDLDRVLAGVPDAEPQRDPVRSERRDRAQRIPTLRLDLDHLRPQVREDAARRSPPVRPRGRRPAVLEECFRFTGRHDVSALESPTRSRLGARPLTAGPRGRA